MFSTANLLTFLRIVISPIFLVIYLQHDSFGISEQLLPFVLLLLLAITELSDIFDGYVARQRKEVTDFGKIFDPMADSISRLSVFLTFTLPPVQIPMLLVFVFLYRDSFISTLRTVCGLKGFALAARTSGKIKAAIQGAVAIFVVVMMIPYSQGTISLEALQTSAFWAVFVAALYTVYSGIDHLVANGRFVKRLLTKDHS